MSTAENVLKFVEEELKIELEGYQKKLVKSMFDNFDRKQKPRTEVTTLIHKQGTLRLWRQIPGYAEFEVNEEGDVRNVLTKLPLKPLGTATGKRTFLLRDDAGIKRTIYADWIIQNSFN